MLSRNKVGVSEGVAGAISGSSIGRASVLHTGGYRFESYPEYKAGLSMVAHRAHIRVMEVRFLPLPNSASLKVK